MSIVDKIRHRMGLVHGTTPQVDEYIGLPGEVTIDTELDQIRRHDGVTKGGIVIYGLTIEDFRSRIAQLEAAQSETVDLSGITTQLDSNTQRILTLENFNLEQLNLAIQSLQQRMTAVENADSSDLLTQLEALEQRMLAVESADNTALSGELDLLKGRVTEIETFDFNLMLSDLESLKSRVDTLEANSSKNLEIVVNDYSSGNWVLPEGVAVEKAFSDSSLQITHNQGKRPFAWSAIDTSGEPNVSIVPTSMTNMQIIDDNTVIITSIESNNSFNITLSF